MVHALRPTLLVDECERLHSDAGREIQQIINAGYKRGATVPRCEGEGHELKFFEVYCPKILAAIKPIGNTVEERSILCVMRRPGVDDKRQNLVVDPIEPVWSEIRSGFYKAPFDYRERIIKATLAHLPDWLVARQRELWSPLLAVARVVDDEGGLDITDDLIQLCKKSSADRGADFESEAIIEVLENLLGDSAETSIHPRELVEPLERALNAKVSPEVIAARLRNLGFEKIGRDRKGVIYRILAATVRGFRERYSPPPETYTPTQDETCTEASPENQKENDGSV